MRLFGCFLPLLTAAALAQNTPPPPELSAAEKQFQDSMTDVTLVGYFTQGDKADLKEDRYVIERISKVGDDLWKFEARIQFNKKDLKVAMPLPVKWAGDTPVISLTRFTVPGMGSYSARVVIYDGAYAGTWGDAQHGGKLFGKIVKNSAAPPQ
jgi:hypothetical protein